MVIVLTCMLPVINQVLWLRPWMLTFKTWICNITSSKNFPYFCAISHSLRHWRKNVRLLKTCLRVVGIVVIWIFINIYRQFLFWINTIFRFNFGNSFPHIFTTRIFISFSAWINTCTIFWAILIFNSDLFCHIVYWQGKVFSFLVWRNWYFNWLKTFCSQSYILSVLSNHVLKFNK